MKAKRVVMKDIAQKAGVHQTTVSLALRNDLRISEETRNRVRKIADELGYVPDPLLTSLVSYRRDSKNAPPVDTLAIVFDVRDPLRFEESSYLPTIQAKAIKRAESLGYKVEVFKRGKDYIHSDMLNRILTTRNIRGVLFGDVDNEELNYTLDWDRYALVKITQAPMELAIDSVMGNYFFSIRKAMRKLKALGFRRPALAVSVVEEHNTRNLYRAGFEYGQRLHFEEENHIPVYEFERKTNEDLELEIGQWIREQKPDVLLSYWNNLYKPVLELTESGHPCQFISLEVEGANSSFGGIQNNFSRMAETAIELLVSKMKLNILGLPDAPNMTLVDEKWIEPSFLVNERA